jgi:hypothetical protein
VTSTGTGTGHRKSEEERSSSSEEGFPTPMFTPGEEVCLIFFLDLVVVAVLQIGCKLTRAGM